MKKLEKICPKCSVEMACYHPTIDDSILSYECIECGLWIEEEVMK